MKIKSFMLLTCLFAAFGCQNKSSSKDQSDNKNGSSQSTNKDDQKNTETKNTDTSEGKALYFVGFAPPVHFITSEGECLFPAEGNSNINVPNNGVVKLSYKRRADLDNKIEKKYLESIPNLKSIEVLKTEFLSNESTAGFSCK